MRTHQTTHRTTGRPRPGRRLVGRAAPAGVALALVLAGCSLSGGDEGGTGEGAGDEVVLATHDSWSMPEAVLERFTEQTGYRVRVLPNGDAGELTNKLVLTKDSPIADAVYGIDNTFASRAVAAGVLAEHAPEQLPASAAAYELPDPDAAERLTPVDWGDVCVNVDDEWFADADLEPPATLDDLTDPAYRDLFVTPAATTSSPGFAFLLATIAEYGEDGWQDYWRRLVGNGAKITSGWSDAYQVDFTAGGGGGDRPLVLSYATSPPFTIPEGEETPTTSALLDTCFRQVEYAGVLDGADNPDGAEALVDFLVGPEVQSALPESMFVYPVDAEVDLPTLWARWATPADDPAEVDPARVAENRDEWLREWGDLTTR